MQVSRHNINPITISHIPFHMAQETKVLYASTSANHVSSYRNSLRSNWDGLSFASTYIKTNYVCSEASKVQRQVTTERTAEPQETPVNIQDTCCQAAHPTPTMNNDDPFDWDVDRVVRELCTDRRCWLLAPADRVLPDPVTFERALRVHDINGWTLLLDLDIKVLKELAPLEPLKSITTVLAAIKWLRERSPKYAENNQLLEQGKLEASSVANAEPSMRLGFAATFEDRNETDSDTPTTVQATDGEDLSEVTGIVHDKNELPADNILETPEEDHETHSAVSDNPTIYHTPAGDDVPELELEMTTSPDSVAHTPTSHDAPQPEAMAVTTAGKLQKKKPRRIAPVFVTSIDENRVEAKIPSLADDVKWFHTENVKLNGRSGEVFLDKNGKRRMNLVSAEVKAVAAHYLRRLENEERKIVATASATGTEQEHVSSEQNTTATGHGTNKDADLSSGLATGYLGSRKMPVDDIFFLNAPMDTMLEDSDREDFVQLHSNISTGRRLYVQRRMKHFLRTEMRVLQKGGKEFVARLPYPADFLPPHQISSFQLCEKPENGGGAILVRADMSKWPDVGGHDRPRVIGGDDEFEATFSVPSADFAIAGPSTYDRLMEDPEAWLKKYRHMQNDVEIPTYNESDSENECDEATWREILEENPDLADEVVPKPASKRRLLTDEEVKEAIREAEELLHHKWFTHIYPKRGLKAWNIWKKHRRDRPEEVARLKAIISRLIEGPGARLPAMRAEIMKLPWTSDTQVRKQCAIMTQSVFDLRDMEWQIETLRKDSEPEKPPPVPKKEKAPAKPERENVRHNGDSESIEREFSTDEDSDGLAGFITDDEQFEEDEVMVDAPLDDSDLDDKPVYPTVVHQKRSRASADEIDDTDADIPMPGIENNTARDEDYDAGKEGETDNHEQAEDVSQESATPRRRSRRQREPYTVSSRASKSPEFVDLTLDDSPAKPSGNQESDREITKRPETDAEDDNVEVDSHHTGMDMDAEDCASEDDEHVEVESDVEASYPLINTPNNAAKGYEYWGKKGDRDRVLVTAIEKMKPDQRTELAELLRGHDYDPEVVLELTRAVMKAMSKDGKRPKGIDSQTVNRCQTVIWLLEIYAIPQYRERRRKKLPEEVYKDLRRQKKTGLFEDFIDDCRTALEYYDGEDDSSGASESERSAKNRLMNTVTNALRVKPVKVSAEARDARTRAKAKVEELDERRQKLRERLKDVPSVGENACLIINESKADHEGLVFINNHIGCRIKQHQIDGIRFMWSNLVAKVSDTEENQGCLLAHTMGLGKTMQAITLLVTIAEAANSVDPSVSCQIPDNLKESKTLVLCPPGLLDNWVDELLLWVPDDLEPKFGVIHKIDATMKQPERLLTIDAWDNTGGVLLLGYMMFSLILSAAENKKDKYSHADVEKYTKARQQLLQRPNIVIADEAHMMRNDASALGKYAKLFRTTHRIALTGSPLANNVLEYHSMIDWVAPNFLGGKAEFKTRYSDPIQQGLYQDSTKGERRYGLRKLAVLLNDIAPKVNRATSGVLQGDLPNKTEFILKLPLTKLQDQLYRVYIDTIVNAADADQKTLANEIKQATLWSWASMLRLLCNHPVCFRSKVLEIETTNKPVFDGDEEDEEDAILLPEKVKGRLSHEVLKIMGDDDNIESIPVHSTKVSVLCQILDACKRAEDKVLVFSQSLDTIEVLRKLFKRQKRKYAILTGRTAMAGRQDATKEFNTDNTEVYLISTTAGGLGLNLYGANRVVIFDSKWNPTHEEQAIGRSYRLGQRKSVYVYRLIAAGTFEEKMHNAILYKTQLAAQVVDKKNILANAKRSAGQYLCPPMDAPQESLELFMGKDEKVLDVLINHGAPICGVIMEDTYNREDKEGLNDEDRQVVQEMQAEEKLRRENPAAFDEMKRREAEDNFRRQQEWAQSHNSELFTQASGPFAYMSEPPRYSLEHATGRRGDVPQSARPDGHFPPSRDPILGSGTRVDARPHANKYQPSASADFVPPERRAAAGNRPTPQARPNPRRAHGRQPVGDPRPIVIDDDTPEPPSASERSGSFSNIGKSDAPSPLVETLAKAISSDAKSDADRAGAADFADELVKSMEERWSTEQDLLICVNKAAEHFRHNRGPREASREGNLEVLKALNAIFGRDLPGTEPQVDGAAKAGKIALHQRPASFIHPERQRLLNKSETIPQANATERADEEIIDALSHDLALPPAQVKDFENKFLVALNRAVSKALEVGMSHMATYTDDFEVVGLIARNLGKYSARTSQLEAVFQFVIVDTEELPTQIFAKAAAITIDRIEGLTPDEVEEMVDTNRRTAPKEFAKDVMAEAIRAMGGDAALLGNSEHVASSSPVEERPKRNVSDHPVSYPRSQISNQEAN